MTSRPPDPPPRVIAHRGFSGRWPENTAPAFAAAIAAGADMIELDARLTAGKRIAVIHDDDLGRYDHPGSRARDLDLDALAGLDAGSWFDPRFKGIGFLGLHEALALIGGRVPVNVEVKVDKGQEHQVIALVEGTLEEIAAAGSPPVIISTFSMSAFRRLRAAAPAIPAAILIGQGDALKLLGELVELGAEGIHVSLGLADRRLVGAAHARGLKVRVYTINDPAVMSELIDRGVDGIFTDWPDRLLLLLERAHSAAELDRAGATSPPPETAAE